MAKEKKVFYTISNSYTTLNPYSDKTKNVWFVFHGMGYLSKYFIKYFSHLDPEENYIIAPQAQSKYYQSKNFKHVGASWLTKENTVEETKNVLAYLDEVFKKEITNKIPNLIILGYSQGVSIATRWVASRKIKCNHLILHSGGIPQELKSEDFNFFNERVKVIYLYGNKDQYINEARETEQLLIGKKLFGKHLKIMVFVFFYEVDTTFLSKLARRTVD